MMYNNVVKFILLVTIIKHSEEQIVRTYVVYFYKELIFVKLFKF